MKIPEFMGIDIGSDSIKIAKVAKKRNAFELVNIAHEASINEFLRTETADSQKKLGGLIKETVQKGGFATRNAVISVAEGKVYSRLLKLPEISANETDEALTWALKPLIPVAIEQVNISSLKVGEIDQNGKKFNNWYVVAAPKQFVESRRRLFQQAGMNLLAVETEALATTRAIAANHEFDHDALIIDIGAEATNIILCRRTGVLFSQSIETASNSFSRALSTDFGIDVTEANNLKATIGIKKTPNMDEKSLRITNSITPVVDIVVTEVQRTIAYYQEKLERKELTNVFLTGGGSLMPGLNEYISSKLGLQAQLANLLNKFEKNEQVKKAEQYNFSSFNVAIGLAMKGSMAF